MKTLEHKAYQLKADGRFPNHPKWPLLVYPGAFSASGADPAAELERTFEANGWSGSWRDGIFSFHHYHSNTHEVLGVHRGTARVQFGGPRGVEVELRAGDVAVLPAGTAHKCIRSSPDLGVVGAYPDGAEYDLHRGEEEERASAMQNIRHVPKPKADPVFGQDGGLCDLWLD